MLKTEVAFQGRLTFHPYSGQKSTVRMTKPQAFSQGPDLSFHVVVYLTCRQIVQDKVVIIQRHKKP